MSHPLDTQLSMIDDDTPSSPRRVRREQSNVVLASYDLDTAVATVRDLKESGLTGPTLDEAANAVAEGSARSTFKNKIYTTIKYGFVAQKNDRVRDRIELEVLPLGEQVLDPERERVARVVGFLSVELNAAIYSRYKNRLLPEPDEFQRMLGELGVSKGQVVNARQVFMRAAKQAGLFEQGRDRLIIPPDIAEEILDHHDAFFTQPVASKEATMSEASVEPHGTVGLTLIPGPATLGVEDRRRTVTLAADLDPAVAAWLQKIPDQNADWPAVKRERWLEMLGHLLSYVFDKDDQPKEP